MLRSIFILVLFMVLVVAAIGAPFTGTLVWTWLSLMTPHKVASGGVAGHWPLNWFVAVITLGSWLFSSESKRFLQGPVAWLWLAFIVDVTLTTVFALSPDLAWERWDKTIKVMALGILVSVLVTNAKRADVLVWVIVLSLGSFGVKGGIFTILHAGHGRAMGPPSSSIADNNYFALALLMVLPLMYYLYLRATLRPMRLALIGAMALTVVAVLGTYSRGGLVGLGIMGIFLWWRSRKRLLTGIVAIVLLVPAVHLMPQQWSERVNTIKNASEQQTWKTRVDAWRVAYHLAQNRPLLGGGFGATENPDVYQRYSFGQSIFKGDRHLPEIRRARVEEKLSQHQIDLKFPPDFTGAHAVHSIYFQVLADHGYPGLLLFLAMMASTWWNLGEVRRLARAKSECEWALDLASMMQVSMAAFLSAGVAVSMCYYDMPYLLLGITLAMQKVLARVRAVDLDDAASIEPVEPSDLQLPGAAGRQSAVIN